MATTRTKGRSPSGTRSPQWSNSAPGRGSMYNLDFLRRRARWIRDDLDPRVAREGADALHADELLKLDEFLRRLTLSDSSVDDIRISRIHIAILDIAGHGTRWPARLIDRCDELKAVWQNKCGPLRSLGILLYEPGGRLHGICTPDENDKEKLLAKWLKKSGDHKLSPLRALRHGDLGFKPGDWWINPTFAYREGIINHGETAGGVVADSVGAYAIVLAGAHERSSTSPDSFVFRASNHDQGRYRLTSGRPESRQSIRVLRSHTLRSFWAPKAGLRYDGLHKMTGWSVSFDVATKAMVYDVYLTRLPGQTPMDEVLLRPWVEEIEDYKEYKRLRQLARQAKSSAPSSTDQVRSNEHANIDGTFEVYEDDSEEVFPSTRDSVRSTRPPLGSVTGKTAGGGPVGDESSVHGALPLVGHGIENSPPPH
ncbi:hypothetical protein LTR62_008007 [Meristemomyces frigidus]|uniref:YDG domain-containing protein n=1 Tax=Meristemomyces frigidus TaxID=1508187 RepID=A0AAN7YMC3_9PEZI|nr:hypothetical protein LTR62_008007 [Meristemomyces frigidus]